MNFIIFVAAFLVVANRHVVQHLFERLSRPKAELRKSEDRKILDRIFRKTGVKLPHFWISDAQSFWGLMAGLPGSPQMFLSTYALDTFTPDELDWLMLHESGHYVLHHTLKEAVYQLALIATGVFVLWNFNNLYLALALGLLLGVMGVQLGKYHEQEAEVFALRRVDNPQGMVISGRRGLRKWYKKYGVLRLLFVKLFSRWEATMHYHRIHMARHEIKRRKNIVA